MLLLGSTGNTCITHTCLAQGKGAPLSRGCCRLPLGNVRIRPGTKLKHLDVSEFCIQGALQAQKVGIGKVTKHPKTGTDVRAALPPLGMLEHEGVNMKATQVSKQPKAWKPPLLALAQGLILASYATVQEHRDGMKPQPLCDGKPTFS